MVFPGQSRLASGTLSGALYFFDGSRSILRYVGLCGVTERPAPIASLISVCLNIPPSLGLYGKHPGRAPALLFFYSWPHCLLACSATGMAAAWTKFHLLGSRVSPTQISRDD